MALTKAEELRKKAQKLKEDARKLEADAKRAEDEAFTKLGVFAAKYLAGTIALDEFQRAGVDLGFDIGGGV